MNTPYIDSSLSFDKPLSEQTLLEIMGRRPRLLVVDDQAANVQVVFKAFSQDHQVFMATSGSQAISVCNEKMPDLVLLDIEMPDMNGYEVCSRLKSNPVTKDICVIFVTSHDNEEAEAKGFSVGAVDFITKPISREIVRARVRTHLLLKQQTDLLRKWVYMDGLTGVFNRRHFNERYSAEWGRAFRHGGPLSLVFIDVDHFKKYNDHYGHQMGDEVLRKISGAFKQVISRAADLIARYGGEEFVCLLPETDAQGAYTVARQISDAVRDLKIEHVQSVDHKIVTVSIGIATFHGGCRGGADDLLRMADECLYQAKNRGRNRINAMLAPLSSDSILPSTYQPPVMDRPEDHYGP